ncbi:pyruvate kinase [Saprolegnia parasitica CBS 223.65]|uniref:Pyruvate kinase n=1 Tax=Saprolegnia parasitica (strain CBS 223.65) TaxID=695850 RepID=A0A067C1I1_SAPPC|nr:pyruvate kinase [Saprolegnia parasitica CBS 223.65]KDO20647.1 pyruvate kinase [Saprolegnia parasitica CBS 223.65]|eukprot:XP_012208613.1 pyruvate kinase [Saprolegnia parasitica CBS 223.65]
MLSRSLRPAGLRSLLARSLSHKPSKKDAFSMTKIVGTIGPVSENAKTTQELTNAGLKIMRINFSHATYDEALLRMSHLRASKGVHAKATGSEFNVRAVLLDTQGPEIRGGAFPEKKVELLKGNKITLTTDLQYKEASTADLLYVTYEQLPMTVKVGDTILLDDGLISLTAESVDLAAGQVHCRIENTEMLGSRKGVNLPGLVVDLPALTAKDKQDVEFGVEHDMDFIAVSFVRKPEDVRDVKDFVNSVMPKYWPSSHPAPLIISKIENYEGVTNFDRILEVSDGIMVARGDLGVEIPMHQVLTCQKDMVAKCNAVGKPVIVATQMLESMIRNPRPTRAEILDVGNAVLDGADAVMLSGEVAQGKWPVESVSTMMSVVKEADAYTKREQYKTDALSQQEAVASAVATTAKALHAAMIVVMTETGDVARLVSKHKPSVPVMCYTTSQKVGRQLQVHRGLYPIVAPTKCKMNLHDAILTAKKLGWLHSGDKVVMLSSDSAKHEMGQQFVMRVATVDEAN